MKKLVMLLVVLALCMPAYGYILVYKLTMSGTRADLETSDDTWLLKKDSGCAYLVLDVNDTNENALNGVQCVDYYTQGCNKLYEIETGGGNFTQTILPGHPPKKNIVRVDIDLTGTTGLLLGTVSSTDIGTLTEDDPPIHLKVDVATSLKGVCVNDTPDDRIGYGTLSGTLDSKWTKTANNPDTETKGFGGDIGSFLAAESGPTGDELPGEPKPPRGLINWLEKTGYHLPID
jgi:hypothetical protein